MSRVRNLPGDPGLERTPLRAAGGPRVGTPFRYPLRRLSREAGLERVLRALHRGFGPQEWWPARTPFEVIVGAVLTQNTAWTNVERALARLRRTEGGRGPTPAGLLRASDDELEERIRPSGTFRAKAAKLRAVAAWYLEAGGLRALRERALGPLRAELLGVHGVGPETADAILCYAGGRRAPIVDAYTRRLLGRHALAPPGAPYEELRAYLAERLVASQAVYEEFHALCVRAGYNHCKPTPRCETCPAPPPPPSPVIQD
ncbi:MAG: endonuclease [Planctomycetota bacterium]